MSGQILVVEDEKTIAAFVATALEREGYPVAWVRTGRDTLSHVQGSAPDLVLRYLEAGTLKDRLAQGPLPLSEVNHIIGQVGSALDYAHRMGVIHRDVKPTYNLNFLPEGATHFQSASHLKQELSNVRGRKLGNDDLHHFFQAGLARGLPVGLLSHVFVMGKAR